MATELSKLVPWNFQTDLLLGQVPGESGTDTLAVP